MTGRRPGVGPVPQCARNALLFANDAVHVAFLGVYLALVLDGDALFLVGLGLDLEGDFQWCALVVLCLQKMPAGFGAQRQADNGGCLAVDIRDEYFFIEVTCAGRIDIVGQCHNRNAAGDGRAVKRECLCGRQNKHQCKQEKTAGHFRLPIRC